MGLAPEEVGGRQRREAMRAVFHHPPRSFTQSPWFGARAHASEANKFVLGCRLMAIYGWRPTLWWVWVARGSPLLPTRVPSNGRLRDDWSRANNKLAAGWPGDAEGLVRRGPAYATR